MIREPYIGMPITIGGPGCMPGHPGSQRPPSRPPAGQKPPVCPPQQPPDFDSPSGAGFDGRLLGSLPIAMAYTPMQQWNTTYPPSTALLRGTVFPELDLPWEGTQRGGMRP